MRNQKGLTLITLAGILLLMLCQQSYAASLKATVSLAASIESREWMWVPNFKNGYAPELTVEYDKNHVDVLLWEKDGSFGVIKYKNCEFKVVKEIDGYTVRDTSQILAERLIPDRNRVKMPPKQVGHFVANDPLPKHLEFLVMDREMYGADGKKYWRYKPRAESTTGDVVSERINIAADRVSVTIEKIR